MNLRKKLKLQKWLGKQKVFDLLKMQLQLKVKSNFKSTAKDILITSQLRSALIFNKKLKLEITL